MANRLLTKDEVAEIYRPYVEAMLDAQIEEFKAENPGVEYEVFLVPARGSETMGHFEVVAK